MTGFAMVSVTENLKITDIKVFYKPENFLRRLQGQKPVEGSPSSLQQIQNLIKLSETEISQKSKNEWKTVSKELTIHVNGKDVSNLVSNFNEKVVNICLSDVIAFPWRVTEVFSNAPEISFTWRHCPELDDGKKELKGFAIFKLNEQSEVKSIQTFYKK